MSDPAPVEGVQEAGEGEKPKLKPCCACPETKKHHRERRGKLWRPHRSTQRVHEKLGFQRLAANPGTNTFIMFYSAIVQVTAELTTPGSDSSMCMAGQTEVVL
ncbi:Cytochrome c oxidase copper chaperone [Branchiostoma belcheri]|nr:Cytochrome c oxidase copper chaperone [Branchiostoma belcheri]